MPTSEQHPLHLPQERERLLRELASGRGVTLAAGTTFSGLMLAMRPAESNLGEPYLGLHILEGVIVRQGYDRVVECGKVMADLLYVLRHAEGAVVPSQEIAGFVWQTTEREGHSKILTTVHRARYRIGGLGLAIINARNVGYSLQEQETN